MVKEFKCIQTFYQYTETVRKITRNFRVRFRIRIKFRVRIRFKVRVGVWFKVRFFENFRVSRRVFKNF